MLFFRSGKNSTKSDAEIIAEFRNTGEMHLIGILFDRYSHLVFAVSMKYLKNEEESKDAVLRIFEKLPSDLVRFEIRLFSAWIHTVTRNHCLRLLSRNRKSAYDVERIPDPADSEEDSFINDYLPHLKGAISLLVIEQRTCIELFYINNLSYQEVSEATGYTLNQVKSYIQNGKRNLKIILQKHSDDKR